MGRLFVSNFLGSSANANECDIENISAISFRRYGDIIDASADEIITIKNYRLSYIIRYQLEKFNYNLKHRLLFTSAIPLFEEMDKSLTVESRVQRLRKRPTGFSDALHALRLYKINYTKMGLK